MADEIEVTTEMLEEEIKEAAYSFSFESQIVNVTSFEDGGYLTRDNGLVIQMEDGSKFFITITQQ